jgi:hypothetical protein
VFTGIPAVAQPGGRFLSLVLRVLVAVGLVAIAVAWTRASDTVTVSSQVDWAPVGLAGVVAVALGLLGSILVARQAVALRLAPFIADLSPSTVAGATAGTMATAAGPVAGAPVTGAGSEPLVAGLNMARYHRTSCPLTAGKAVSPESRRGHEQAGRRACGVCAP